MIYWGSGVSDEWWIGQNEAKKQNDSKLDSGVRINDFKPQDRVGPRYVPSLTWGRSENDSKCQWVRDGLPYRTTVRNDAILNILGKRTFATFTDIKRLRYPCMLLIAFLHTGWLWINTKAFLSVHISYLESLFFFLWCQSRLYSKDDFKLFSQQKSRRQKWGNVDKNSSRHDREHHPARTETHCAVEWFSSFCKTRKPEPHGKHER